MTPEQWQRIEGLFHEAAELEPDKRAAFLKQACGNDAALQKEVESLLAYEGKSAKSLQAPVVGMIGEIIGEPPHQSIVGQSLDHYKILSPLGAGGMGEVYLAEDVRLNRNVAIKLLPASLLTNSEQVRRLQQEARAASALNHPNIITIYELGQTDSQPFIAMEFIEGYTLRQKIQSGSLKMREALDIAIQVASGLAAAHTAQQGSIIHRDIKPENIMVSRDGFVKILDFGIAKFKEQQAYQAAAATDGALTGNAQASAMWGTVSYMSPEQAEGKTLDARTDIFSLGIVLFEMIAGRRPFAGETQAETLQAILNTEAQPLKAFRRDVPSGLQEIFDKALKKKREERYQTAREMFDAMREVSEQADTATDTTERANQMLRKYLSISAADKGALIPIRKLRFIRKYSDWRRSERGRELWQKSLRYGLLRLLAVVVAILGVTLVAGTWFTKSQTWEEAILKDGHTRAVRQVAFSPDGKLLVSVSEDKRVIVWDFQRRMPIATLTDHTDWVQTVAFSPDGKWFATGGKEKRVIIWDAARLQKVTTLNDSQGEIFNLAFSPDSRMLAVKSGEDPEAHITLRASGQWTKFREFSASRGYGNLLFSPDGQLLFYSSLQMIWDVQSGEEVTNHYSISGWGGNWIALSPDGRQLAGIGSNVVTFGDLNQRKILKPPPAHQDFGRALAFSPDGKLLASGAEDIILWDAATRKLITHLVYTSIVWNVVFSPDGKYLVSTHGDGAILLWSVEERKLIANLNDHSAPVRSVTFSPDGKMIASGSEDASIILWDALQRKKQEVITPNNGRINSIAFAPDGKGVVADGWSKTILLWDAEQGQRRITVSTTDNVEQIVAMSPDGRWVASSHRVYDSRDGQIVFDFINLPREGMYGAAFSKDGRWLACATPDGYLYLIDTETWQLHDHILQSDMPFISLSFSPDNQHIVTGDDKGVVQLWQIEPLEKIAILGQHKGRIKSVAFSLPDGKEVASAGDDNSIKLWSVSGRLIDSIGTHTAPVLSVAFSPDGKYLVSGEHDNSVRLYTRHQTYWGKRWD